MDSMEWIAPDGVTRVDIKYLAKNICVLVEIR